MSINVIIADDHAMVRNGIKAAIELKSRDIKVVGEASNGYEIIEMAKKKPDVIYILDIFMPRLNGIETAQRLIKKHEKAKIIILSMYDKKSLVEKALMSGVKGYILKESAIDEMVQAIKEVNIGRCFLSPKISEFVVQKFREKKQHKSDRYIVRLTAREREVLQLIAEGFTNKRIAKDLNISFNTSHIHRKNIMQKLDLHKQADLIRYAIKEDIVKV